MEPIIDRVRNGFRKAADRVSGRYVPVVTSSPATEELQDEVTRRPAVDVLENDDEVLLVADVPGSTPDAARIGLEGDRRLVLRAPCHGSEGTWYRAFDLPGYIDPSAARAALRRGVLSVHLPKRKETTPRSIPIRVGSS